MLKRRIIRGGTLVLALVLANLAVAEWAKENQVKQKEYEVAQADVLSQNVLEENTIAENRNGKTGAESREEDFVSKTEAYPYLYAKGEITKQELPEKTVFLTFDDGPSRNTKKILDTLKKYDINATFFVIGENLTEDGVETVKRALEEGHMLGMHTETHSYEQIYHSVDAFLKDYDKLAARFVELFGECPGIYRFPGGSYSTYINPIKEELKEEMKRRGFLGYDWSVSGEDSVGTPTAASIKKNIFDTIEGQKYPIILLHDSPRSNLTAEVLPEIIERLLAEGYTFKTLQYREPYQFPW